MGSVGILESHERQKLLKRRAEAGCDGAPLNPAFRRRRQVDFCELEASLVNIVSSGPAKIT